ncbi:MAG: DnaJ C-terminal domain-containing protein [Planctomycetota bacterium]
MSVQFKDYYEILGVDRKATPDQIKQAYRQLARKYHPDVSKEPDAVTRFQEINEAHEVLKDPEKRARYDTLGAGYANGQSFEPPPGFGGGGMHFDFQGGSADVSDFFSMLFGRGGGFGGGPGFQDPFRGVGGRSRSGRGEDLEAELTLTLAELARGDAQPVTLTGQDGTRRTFEVRIPPGTTDGTRVRLGGQGGPGVGPAGRPGDLFLRVRLERDPRFEIDGTDLRTQVAVAPWEAALGALVEVESLDGVVALKIPAGCDGGQTLRLRGLGLPRGGGIRGDLLVRVRIVTPKGLTDEEKRLFEELRDRSGFRPRG